MGISGLGPDCGRRPSASSSSGNWPAQYTQKSSKVISSMSRMYSIVRNCRSGSLPPRSACILANRRKSSPSRRRSPQCSQRRQAVVKPEDEEEPPVMIAMKAEEVPGAYFRRSEEGLDTRSVIGKLAVLGVDLAQMVLVVGAFAPRCFVLEQGAKPLQVAFGEGLAVPDPMPLVVCTGLLIGRQPLIVAVHRLPQQVVEPLGDLGSLRHRRQRRQIDG